MNCGPISCFEKVNEPLEQKTLGVLEVTAKEPSVKEALEIFHLLAKGRYRTIAQESCHGSTST